MEINLDFRGKTWSAFGVRGSGKSTLTDKILSSYGSLAVYYDTLSEADNNCDFDFYRPKNRYSVDELQTFLSAIIPKVNTTPIYRMIAIDECNRFCPPKPTPLPPMVADLNDICRHYGVSVGFIARRPVQLNQDLTELSDYIFIFQLSGKNDIKYLDNLSDNLGQTVKKLKKFEFVLVNRDRSYQVMNPINARQEWIDNARKLLSR